MSPWFQACTVFPTWKEKRLRCKKWRSCAPSCTRPHWHPTPVFVTPCSGASVHHAGPTALPINGASVSPLQRYQDAPGVDHIPVVQIDLSVPLKVPGKCVPGGTGDGDLRPGAGTASGLRSSPALHPVLHPRPSRHGCTPRPPGSAPHPSPPGGPRLCLGSQRALPSIPFPQAWVSGLWVNQVAAGCWLGGTCPQPWAECRMCACRQGRPCQTST